MVCKLNTIPSTPPTAMWSSSPTTLLLTIPDPKTLASLLSFVWLKKQDVKNWPWKLIWGYLDNELIGTTLVLAGGAVPKLSSTWGQWLPFSGRSGCKFSWNPWSSNPTCLTPSSVYYSTEKVTVTGCWVLPLEHKPPTVCPTPGWLTMGWREIRGLQASSNPLNLLLT